MYKSIYLKPNINKSTYINFVADFINQFQFKKIKQVESIYFLENNDMMVKIEPCMAQILIHDVSNREVIFKLKRYFFNN